LVDEGIGVLGETSGVDDQLKALRHLLEEEVGAGANEDVNFAELALDLDLEDQVGVGRLLEGGVDERFVQVERKRLFVAGLRFLRADCSELRRHGFLAELGVGSRSDLLPVQGLGADFYYGLALAHLGYQALLSLLPRLSRQVVPLLRLLGLPPSLLRSHVRRLVQHNSLFKLLLPRGFGVLGSNT